MNSYTTQRKQSYQASGQYEGDQHGDKTNRGYCYHPVVRNASEQQNIQSHSNGDTQYKYQNGKETIKNNYYHYVVAPCGLIV